MSDKYDFLWDIETDYGNYDEYDCYSGPSPREEYLELKVWTSFDGKKTRISKMDDNHLINTYKYLKRNGKLIPYAMDKELNKRKLGDKVN